MDFGDSKIKSSGNSSVNKARAETFKQSMV